jgi:hypothetical protein
LNKEVSTIIRGPAFSQDESLLKNVEFAIPFRNNSKQHVYYISTFKVENHKLSTQVRMQDVLIMSSKREAFISGGLLVQ